MIEATIKAVQEAEAKADELIAEAKKQAAEVLAASETKIGELKEAAKQQAKADAEAKLLAARAEGEKILADGEAESGKEIKSLTCSVFDHHFSRRRIRRPTDGTIAANIKPVALDTVATA